MLSVVMIDLRVHGVLISWGEVSRYLKARLDHVCVGRVLDCNLFSVSPPATDVI